MGIILFVLVVFLYYNYQRTNFVYHNDVPDHFFDDIWRIIVENDQYDKLNAFMSGEYATFLKSWIDIQNISGITAKFDQAIMSGDKQYFIDNKELIIDLEKAYQESQIPKKIDAILSIWTRWHMRRHDNPIMIFDDLLPNLREIIKHLSWMTILRCNLVVDQKLCNQYQKITKWLVEKSDRRSSLVSNLITINNTNYVINQEKISWIQHNLCSGWKNWEERFKRDMIDEYNIMRKNALKLIVDGLQVDGLQNGDQFSSIGFLPRFIFRTSDNKSLAQEIDIQTTKKFEELFYDHVVQKKLEKRLNALTRIPITKIALASIWIQSNHLLADVISNILSDSIAGLFSWKAMKRYEALWKLCENN